MRSRVCWVALLALLLGLVGAVPAAAGTTPSVSVSPTTGLRNGTSVTVSGAGLPADVAVDVIECDTVYPDDWGGLLQACPALTTVTSSGTGTLTASVDVVELTYRQEFSDTVPVDCRDDGCKIFLRWQDADDPTYLKDVASGELDFASHRPTVTVTPDSGLSELQRVVVSGTFDGARGRTVEVLEQACFAIVQASGCQDQQPAVRGTVAADDTFRVTYPATRRLSDDDDCAHPDPFLNATCRISAYVLDDDGRPDDSFGLSSEGEPGARISFTGAEVSASPGSGLSRGDAVTLTGSGLSPSTSLRVVQCDAWALPGPDVSSCPVVRTVRTSASGALSARVTVKDLVLRTAPGGAREPVYCRDDGCRLFLVATDQHAGGGGLRLEARTEPLSFVGSTATLKANPSKNLAAVKWTTLWGRAAGAEGRSLQVVEQACYPAGHDGSCYGQLPVRWGKVKADGTFVVKYPARRFLGDAARTDCRDTKTAATCRISVVVLDAEGRHDDSFGVRDLGQPGVEISFR